MLLIRLNVYRRFCVPAALLVAGLSGIAEANSVTFVTATGAKESSGNPVSATATITTKANAITVTLQDLLVNPVAVSQNISDFSFTLSNSFTGLSIHDSSGVPRTIVDSGAYSDGTAGSTGWGLDATVGNTIHLDDLGFAGPKDTIIGPPGSGGYTNANSSIAKTGGPHNPFLAGTVTFDLTATGVTANTNVTSAVFSFGTSPNNDVTGVISATPLPASVWGGLALLGGLGIARVRRRVV